MLKTPEDAKKVEPRAHPGRRLVLFVLGLALLLGMLELLVSRNIPLFEGASHRMLAKLAILGEQKQVDILFFGTSQTLDGISPRLVSRHLAEISQEFKGVLGFNASSTGSNYKDLLTLAPRYAQRPGLRTVVIELSKPHFSNKSLLPTTVVELGESNEDRLIRGLKHVAFVRYRTAFLSDNLGRLPALLFFSPYLSGCETRGSEQIASWLGREESSPIGFDENLWTPESIIPLSGAAPLETEQEIVVTQITKLAQAYTERGIRVVFSIPPLSARSKSVSDRGRLQAVFAAVAERTGCEIWDFSAQLRPDKFFKDPSHLSLQMGRAHWSYALAQQLAKRNMVH